MSLPGVNIVVTNGNLGRVAGTVDSVSGLLLTGAAVASKLVLGTPYQIFSVKDANLLGLDAAYDLANSTDAYRQIADFYTGSSAGTELWVMVVAPATTLTQMADPTLLFAKTLLDGSQGRIRLLGLTRNPAGSYAPTVTQGIDPDVLTAMLKAQLLADGNQSVIAPLIVLIEGRAFTGVLGDLFNFRGSTCNNVGVVMAGLGAGKLSGAVGKALGRFANIPVQRNPGRVKDGDVGLAVAYLTDGTLVTSKNDGFLNGLHDKGVMFMRKFPNVNGFYWNDDPSCSPLSDDYSSLARKRIINKALIITYQTYVNEIQDDIEVDELGRLDPSVAKSYQAQIEKAIYTQMQVNGEISGVKAEIDVTQNVLVNDSVNIVLSIRPKGYSKFIKVDLGFQKLT